MDQIYMSEPIQSFTNHTRRDPVYLSVLLLSFALLIWSFVHHFQVKTMDSFFIGMLFFLLLLTTMLIRTYSLRVQDRVIRLEERLRLQSLAGEALRARIPELTRGQLVALRFASDAEVAALATKALDENLAPKQIKALIQNWRADFLRV